MPCRKIGVFLRRFPQIGTDVVALLDEWAVHFFEELDYVHEVGILGILTRIANEKLAGVNSLPDLAWRGLQSLSFHHRF